jgi:hypothetical protein
VRQDRQKGLQAELAGNDRLRVYAGLEQEELAALFERRE